MTDPTESTTPTDAPQTQPLDEVAIGLFAQEIRIHIKRLDIVAEEFGLMAKRVMVDGEDLDTWAAWDLIDRLITYFGRIADILWPSQRRGDALPRAAQLRSEFGFGIESPLALRDARNSAEHFAERMDEFLTGRQRGWMYSSLVWDGSGSVVAPNPRSFARLFVAPDLTAYVWGRKIELMTAIDEVHRIDYWVTQWEESRKRRGAAAPATPAEPVDPGEWDGSHATLHLRGRKSPPQS